MMTIAGIGIAAVVLVVGLILIFGRDVFLTVFGFLISSALIFFFGIWVGRDIAERRLVQEERVVRQPVPVQPTAAKEEAGGSDVDLAFYQKIKERAVQRLQETAGAVASPTPARGAQVPTAPRAAARATVKPPLAATPAPHGAHAEPTASSGDDWADAGWTVQVNATTNPQQASDLAHRLRSKGFDSYTVQAPMRGQTWYRVRVGRFPSREKAKEMETRLKTSEGLENAYVTPQ